MKKFTTKMILNYFREARQSLESDWMDRFVHYWLFCYETVKQRVFFQRSKAERRVWSGSASLNIHRKVLFKRLSWLMWLLWERTTSRKTDVIRFRYMLNVGCTVGANTNPRHYRDLRASRLRLSMRGQQLDFSLLSSVIAVLAKSQLVSIKNLDSAQSDTKTRPSKNASKSKTRPRPLKRGLETKANLRSHYSSAVLMWNSAK